MFKTFHSLQKGKRNTNIITSSFYFTLRILFVQQWGFIFRNFFQELKRGGRKIFFVNMLTCFPISIAMSVPVGEL